MLRPEPGTRRGRLAGLCLSLALWVLPCPGTPGLQAAAAPEWNQEAGNAQRTGFIAEEPAEPWTLKWTWNGPDSSGGSGGHFYDAPRQGYTVMGGGAIYAPAGAQGLYALELASGAVRWNLRAAAFNSTPAYDPATASVFAGGADGRLYKVNAATGAHQSYATGSPINRGVLLAGGFVFVLSDDGRLHKLSAATLEKAWTYGGAAPAPLAPPAGPHRLYLPLVSGGTGVAGAGVSAAPGTGLAYSASRDVIIYASEDLYVQAVNNATGSLKWRVKPSPNPPGFPNQFLWYWPVVADQNGVVFVRMRLDHNSGLWGCGSAPCGPGAQYPDSNAETRAFLAAHPSLQNLFALSLDSGTPAFLPAVGYGGTEEMVAGQAFLTTGPVPVVRVWPDGTEVAYIHFRSGQSGAPDGRWDSNMGEMVLNDHSLAGLAAGDLRFVRMSGYNGYGGNSFVYITDEQNALTMAGATLFHAHWVGSEAVRLTDRSAARGLSYAAPIESANRPVVIRRLAACSSYAPATHRSECLNLSGYGDGRYYSGPGFWTYWNTWDPPTPPSTAIGYDDGMRPRYTYVSGGYIVVAGNGGELMVFSHS